MSDYDDYDDWDRPVPMNLTQADKGYDLCPECLGQGTGMIMVYYGSSPVERDVYCEHCDGEGQVPKPSRWQRFVSWFQVYWSKLPWK